MNLEKLIKTIDTVHKNFQAKALQSVSVNLTLRNFVIGYYIVEYEQNGSDKAAYGTRIIENLAQKLAHIKGMSVTALKLMRQFYLTYPQISQSLTDQFKIDTKISQSVIDQSENTTFSALKVPAKKLLTSCSFTHFIELVKIDDELKRTFYEVETIKGNWSVRELKRQIASLLYERVGLSVAPIGIILCTEKNNIKVEYATAGLDKNLFVSKYKIMLPTTEELEELVKEDLEEMTIGDVNEKQPGLVK